MFLSLKLEDIPLGFSMASSHHGNPMMGCTQWGLLIPMSLFWME